RLSVDNPLALLGGDAIKFSEMFQKDLAARAVNNGGIPSVPISLSGGGIPAVGGISPPLTGLEKTNLEMGTGHPFSRFREEDNEIEIN
ncbi:hypothetical protein M9458_033297, partial [Cirrhinus mrigala]